MSKSKGLPNYRPGVPRFAVAELGSPKKAHRFSIARIEGKLRSGQAWRVTDDMFTSQEAGRIVEQLNRLVEERARGKENSCIVLNTKKLSAYLCPVLKAKTLRAPNLVVD